MKNSVVLVTKAGLGNTPPGDEAFGVEMIDNFFHTMEKLSDKPAAVCFYTEGVKLLAADSPISLSLKLLDRLGIPIVACGSCLDHYNVGDARVAGRRGTMVEIVELLGAADKVITI